MSKKVKAEIMVELFIGALIFTGIFMFIKNKSYDPEYIRNGIYIGIALVLAYPLKNYMQEKITKENITAIMIVLGLLGVFFVGFFNYSVFWTSEHMRFQQSNPYTLNVYGEIHPDDYDVREVKVIVSDIKGSFDYICNPSPYGFVRQAEKWCKSQGYTGFGYVQGYPCLNQCYSTRTVMPDRVKFYSEDMVLYEWAGGNPKVFEIDVTSLVKSKCSNAFKEAELCYKYGDCHEDRECEFEFFGESLNGFGEVQLREKLKSIDLKFYDLIIHEDSTIFDNIRIWFSENLYVGFVVFICLLFGGLMIYENQKR